MSEYISLSLHGVLNSFKNFFPKLNKITKCLWNWMNCSTLAWRLDKNLLSQNIDINTISTATGLSIAEIQQLKDKIWSS